MHALQYAITLPADYDMGVIRHRVATRGHALDGLPGLGLKAYLTRERADGSPVNEYAPFYLWDDPDALTGFLAGPGFAGLSADFGRPAVRTWHGLERRDGPARGATPRYAERGLTALPEDADVAAVTGAAREELRAMAEEDDVHTAALALDPRRWELVRLVLRTGPAPDTAPGPATARYQVLHLSEGAEGAEGSERRPA